ncbi:MAG: TRAP transporter substrate-binding protein [Burkholderiales bacterium]|nr:TRAP transporter substrate-binding protein [Burkholderiales bacterium]
MIGRVCGFILAFALAAFAAAGVAHAQQIVLTASSWVPPSHTLSKSQARWCEDVALATAGRVKCNILPKPVSAPPGTFEAVREGLADVSFSVHGYTPGRYLLTQIAELPFAGDSAEVTSLAYQRIHQRFLARFNEHLGLKVLAVFTHGPGQIYNIKRPVASLADLRGLKFRIGGGISTEIGKALGVTSTLQPSTEAYELLAAGAIDGVFFPAESIEAFKLEKLIKYRTDFPGGLYNTSFAFVMNLATWNRIGKTDQQAIDRLSGEHAARLFGRGWDQVDRRGTAFMQANHVQTLLAGKAFIDAVRARTASLEQKWIAEARAKGLANAEQVLREYRAEIERLQ